MGTLPDGHISSKTTQLGCVQQVARGLRGGIAPQGDIAGPLAAAPSRGSGGWAAPGGAGPQGLAAAALVVAWGPPP